MRSLVAKTALPTARSGWSLRRGEGYVGVWRKLAFFKSCRFGAMLLVLASLPAAPAQTGSVAATEGRPLIPAKLGGALCTTRVSGTLPMTGVPQQATAVTLRLFVSRAGTPIPVRLVDGPPTLELAAMDAVRLWKCHPYTRDGEPIDILTDVQVEFTPSQPSFVTTTRK